MATKAELAAQLGDPSLADQYKRDELLTMVEDLDGAERRAGLVTVYRVEDGAVFNVPDQAAVLAVNTGQWSYTPVERPTRKKDG